MNKSTSGPSKPVALKTLRENYDTSKEAWHKGGSANTVICAADVLIAHLTALLESAPKYFQPMDDFEVKSDLWLRHVGIKHSFHLQMTRQEFATYLLAVGKTMRLYDLSLYAVTSQGAIQFIGNETVDEVVAKRMMAEGMDGARAEELLEEGEVDLALGKIPFIYSRL